MRTAFTLLLLVVLLLAPAAAKAANRYQPHLRFRTISTPRFDIHFHQGEEGLARRLAGFVESAAREVDAAIGAAVGRVQVILVNQHDLSNGWATPLPYNIIEISAAGPPAGTVIGNTTDWLRLVFVHEYTHIAHLSRSGGWLNGLRRVLGRQPVLFPNVFQPLWAIEGIATWQESRAAWGGDEGRVHAGDFRALLSLTRQVGRFESPDRVSGGNVDWPGGTGPYLYGAFFHDYLARRYGEDAVRALAAETGRRLPYLGARAYKEVFGRSLGALWRDFEAETEAPPAEPVRATRLTRHGFSVSTPRFAGDGRLFYSLATPHAFPAVMELPGVAPATRAEPRRVSSRYLGDSIGVVGEDIVVDERDLVDGVALQSDLWLVRTHDGDRRRLTKEARAGDPDVSPDGRTIVCTVQLADRRVLATLTLPPPGTTAEPRLLAGEADTDFSGPRWSPDGEWIAAERRRLGRVADIVLVHVPTGRLRVLASGAGRAAAPSWTTDGAVLFSRALPGEPFRIHRVDVASGSIERLEGTGPTAQAPVVSPDGRILVFVGASAGGYDLFAQELAGATWTPLAHVADQDLSPSGGANLPAPVAPTSESNPGRRYRPYRTLLPTFWTPTLESDGGELVAGAATGSADALGRHAYGVEAGWAARLRPDWQLAYAYDRWRPTVFAAVSDDTDPWREGERRVREADAGMLIRFSRVRRAQSLLTSVHHAQETEVCAGCPQRAAAALDRTSGRVGYLFDSARAFGYSVSAEEGGRLGATLEASRASLALAGEADRGRAVAVTIDGRRYWRVSPRHAVIAARLSGAGSRGDRVAVQQFSASGSGIGGSAFGFGLDAVGLLRGFDPDDVVGRHAAVANVDYRFPLVRVNRGYGTVPLFLRTIHGAIFADAGSAWDGRGDRRARAALGVEVSADTVLGFALPLTVTAGVALRHDEARHVRGPALFTRIGRAF